MARSLLILRVHLARLRGRFAAAHGLSPADAAAVAAALVGDDREGGMGPSGEDLETIMGVARAGTNEEPMETEPVEEKGEKNKEPEAKMYAEPPKADEAATKEEDSCSEKGGWYFEII